MAEVEAGRVAHDGGHFVAARKRLVEDGMADVAGGAEQGDVHGSLRWVGVETSMRQAIDSINARWCNSL